MERSSYIQTFKIYIHSVFEQLKGEIANFPRELKNTKIKYKSSRNGIKIKTREVEIMVKNFLKVS